MRLLLSLLLLSLLFGAAGSFQGIPSRAENLPESAYVAGVVGHPQTYTLSCEARSAVDWARFWGVSISEVEFLNRLPRSDNPNKGFVGDPSGYWGGTPPASYGVHAEPVAELLQDYGLPAEARHGLSWDDLRSEIAEGRLVIVWVIGQMWAGNGFDYTDSEGETARVAAFEHTMILVGYDNTWVQVVDASSGWTQTYSIEAFLRSWGVLGNMAVVWAEPAAEEQPAEENPIPPPPAPTATLTAYAFLITERAYMFYFPLVAQQGEYGLPVQTQNTVFAAGVCFFSRRGVLYAEPLSAMRGWCVSPLSLRPEYFLRLAGSIPELP